MISVNFVVSSVARWNALQEVMLVFILFDLFCSLYYFLFVFWWIFCVVHIIFSSLGIALGRLWRLITWLKKLCGGFTFSFLLVSSLFVVGFYGKNIFIVERFSLRIFAVFFCWASKCFAEVLDFRLLTFLFFLYFWSICLCSNGNK
jgi:hypothetical protein